MRIYLDIAAQAYGYSDSYEVRKSDHTKIKALAKDLKQNDDIVDEWWIKYWH